MRRDRQPLLRRLMNQKTMLALGALAIFVVGSGLIQLVLRRRAVDDDIARLEAEARQLEGKNSDMLTLIQRFQTSGFLEREARLKLNMQKPGETVVVIERTVPVVASTTVRTVAVRDANWKRWWWYFFDRTRLVRAD